jgi:hypothetical protein
MKGFSSTWRAWAVDFVQQSSVAIEVNDVIGPFFQTKKGLRQGGPLSHVFFNIMADMLAILINRARRMDRLADLFQTCR